MPALVKRVEEGGLADVGQADDAALETHGGTFRMLWGTGDFRRADVAVTRSAGLRRPAARA